jgi:ATP-binding cassette subfamily F protein uup
MGAADAALSGKLVVVTEDVSKSYGGRPIVSHLTTRVLRGDRLGIVGPNGAGKSTLLKLFTGLEKPDSGRSSLGTNLNIITLDQQRAALDPERDAGQHADRRQDAIWCRWASRAAM